MGSLFVGRDDIFGVCELKEVSTNPVPFTPWYRTVYGGDLCPERKKKHRTEFSPDFIVRLGTIGRIFIGVYCDHG